MKQILYIIFLFTFFSCQENEDNTYTSYIEDETSIDTEEIIKNLSPTENIQESADIEAEIYVENSDDFFQINFADFSLIIDSVMIWDEKEMLKFVQKDTAFIYVEIGEMIEDKTIKVIQHTEGEIKIYQRYENSITIMNEGPHCDLIDWKHYDSEWEPLILKNSLFQTSLNSEEDWTTFIDVDMKEVQEAVRNQCGNDWANLLNDTKSVTEYPCAVGNSRIFLKIEFINAESGLLKEHIVSFETPLGC